jgi:hypothetical protein
VNLDEIISEVIKGCGSGMVLQLTGKTIRETGVAAHVRADGREERMSKR